MDTIFLSVAGIIIKISLGPTDQKGVKERFIRLIKSNYKGFISQPTKKIDYHILFIGKGNMVLERQIEGKDIGFVSYYKKVNMNKIITYYHISFTQLQLIIRQALHRILVERDGFILHASAVQVGNSAVCFMGRPGAGKSTAMRLLKSYYPPLADDSVIIVSEGKKFSFYQTPFIEKNSWFNKKENKLPLKAVLFLRKSKQFKIEEIEDREYILGRVVKQVLSDEKLLGEHMQVIFPFVKKTHFGILFFAKNSKKLASAIARYED